MKRDFVLVRCETCCGQGEWEQGPLPSFAYIEPEYRHVICPDCKGSGRAYVDAEEVERDDDLKEREQ